MNSLLPKTTKTRCDAAAKGGEWCKFRAKWAHTGPFSLCGHHERELENREHVHLGDGSLGVKKRDGSTYIEGRRRFDRTGRPFVRSDEHKD